jgi:hypothetical protein
METTTNMFFIFNLLIPINIYHIKSGRYKINFNSENLSSGVYLYQLISGSYSKTLKMIVAK